jgi:glycosyltransferase involved in cell wall biosynthesis
MPPRLLHICSHFYPATTIGGPVFCGTALLQRLDSLAPQLIITYKTGIDENIWQINTNTRACFGFHSTIRMLSHNIFSYIVLARALLTAISEKKLIFLHGTYNYQYVFSVLLLSFFGYKCFILPHGTLDYNRRISSRSFLIRNLSSFYIKHLLYKHYIIFTNKTEYKSVRLPQLKPDRLSFISNIVPLGDSSLWDEMISPIVKRKVLYSNTSDSTLYNELHRKISAFIQASSNTLSKNSVTLFYFGRVSPEKGLHLILPALTNLHELGYINGLVILGGTDNLADMNSIHATSSKHNLPLFTTGFLPRHVAHELLKSFRPPLVFPSVSDNFNLCLHEALAFGLSCFVSTRINTLDELRLNPQVHPFSLRNNSQELVDQISAYVAAYHSFADITSYDPASETAAILQSYETLVQSFQP